MSLNYRRAIALVLALLPACGTWSDLDAQFLAAVPTKDDLTLSGPAETQSSPLTADISQRQDLLGTSRVYTDVVQQVSDVNKFIDALANGLDFIRKLPPSQRLADARLWGPYDDDKHPGLQIQIGIQRVSATEYHYAVQYRRKGAADFSTVIAGVFYGEKASHGMGNFQVDGRVGKSLGISQAQDAEAVELGYNMSDGLSTVGHLKAQYSAAALEYAYATKRDGSGEVSFTVTKDFVAGPLGDETLRVSAHWLDSQAGSASAEVSGGDLGTSKGTQQECWDESARQVYLSKNFDCSGASCTEGSPSACRLAPPTP